jgi:hypothetical protein
MSTQRQLKLAAEMRLRLKRLRNLNYPDKKLEKLIRHSDVPLGLKLNLLKTKR